MKVDTSKIEGYAEMNLEQKLAALEAYEYESNSPNATELEKLKAALSKANSEAANYKKQLREKQTNEEANAAKEAEEREALVEELEKLRKNEKISKFTAKYLEIGYDSETAKKTAKALSEGDFDTVFACHKTLTENLKKAAVIEAMDKQSGISNGSPLNEKDSKTVELNKIRQSMGLNPI